MSQQPLHQGPLSPVKLGAIIQEKRLALRLSQDTLAERAGTNRTTISQLERGDAPDIGLTRLMRVLAAIDLQVTIEKKWRPTLDDLERSKEVQFDEESSQHSRPKG